MSKISETGANTFRFLNQNFDVSNLGKLPGTTGNDTDPNVHPSNRNDYDLKLVYDRSSYLRQSLNNKENSGIGGGEKLNAHSSPQALLKNPRVRALLDVIGYAEGTGKNYGRVVFGRVLGPSDRGAPYDRGKVGKTNVVTNDFRHHPNLAVHWADGQPPSSAAGRYQFLYGTWKGLGMKDFSPRSQDLGAIKLMQRRGMIEPLLKGDFTGAIHKGAAEWASLPTARGGSYYGGQGAKSIGSLRDVYSKSLRRYQGTQPPTPTKPAPTAPKPISHDTLKRGQRGHSVEVLQDKLIHLGLMTKAQKKTGPGIFGPRTEAAVKSFQRSVGIKPSGQAGTNSRAAMNHILSGEIKKGATGGIVRRVQEKLVRLGYMTPAEVKTGPGIFGPKTDHALKRFQFRHGLAADGIFGRQTFKALKNAAPRRQPNQPTKPTKPPAKGNAPEYKRWNVYSTGDRPARQADGFEDLQPHHGPKSQWTNYVSNSARLNHNLQKRDIVLTRPGQGNYGQAVPSPIRGKILFAGDENDGYGNKVVVRDTRTGQIASVNHLESINVRRGETVHYGQKLGGQGNTGNSHGAHVHINADPSVIKRWVADLADGKFDAIRRRFDVGRRA